MTWAATRERMLDRTIYALYHRQAWTILKIATRLDMSTQAVSEALDREETRRGTA